MSESGVEFETPVWIAAGLLLVAALGGAILIGTWPLGGATASPLADSPAEPRIVTPAENGTGLWPYTAKGPDYGDRTLVINLVVLGDPDAVREAMTDPEGPVLSETPPEKEGADEDTYAAEVEGGNGTDAPVAVALWGPARGSTRFTYVVVEDHGGAGGERGDGNDTGTPVGVSTSGRWLTESYQLHDGTYFGRRTHIRAYEDPGGEWTAMQIHEEYWDWFRLRHTVTGVASAQRTVERDFMEATFVDRVVRRPYHHRAPGGGSWVTIVDVSLFLFLVPGFAIGFAFRFDRGRRAARHVLDRHGREIAIGLVLLGLYLGIRWLGIAIERNGPSVNPHLVAGPLYIVLVLGLPTVAHLLGRGTGRVWAFASAVGWLGVAFALDAAAMHVSTLPLQFVLHRTAVLLAIGLIAYGSAVAAERGDRLPWIAGLVAWALVLAPPLLGYV